MFEEIPAEDKENIDAVAENTQENNAENENNNKIPRLIDFDKVKDSGNKGRNRKTQETHKGSAR